MNVDEERFPPRQLQWFINGAQGRGRARRRSVAGGRRRSRAGWSSTTPPTTSSASAKAWSISPSCCCARYELLASNEVLREHYRAALPPHPGRRVPGHQPAAVPLAEAARRPDNAMFAVGDDDQSIYAFRGANVGNMADFERDFAGRSSVIKLEQNYRSHGNILDAANALIANNRKRLGKNLWTADGKGEPVRVFEARADIDEARLIVDEVQALAARRHAPVADRAAVPLERAVARARARAVRRGHSLPRLRRPALLRARRRSSTRSPTCGWSPRPTTTAPSCASSISRRAASARARSSSCRTRAKQAGASPDEGGSDGSEGRGVQAG